ncbi:hypothetical protein MXD59_12690 [Frankia sp. Ag45/Mut15]|uniref:Uncharacterized protein n=1 Tax=Frankia umida TaxID=573489 RepID=A0ABT0JYU5_9ACTN|nr:hypothetical protein [Frankia umida]MCK9876625.1 hypothetical protein [Frankia umida]
MPFTTPSTIADGLRNAAVALSEPAWQQNQSGPLTAAHAEKLLRLATRVERGIHPDDERLDAFADYAFTYAGGGCFLATPPEVDTYLADVPEHVSPGRFLTGLADTYRSAAPLSQDTVAYIVETLAAADEQKAAGRTPVRDINADGLPTLRYIDRPRRVI